MRTCITPDGVFLYGAHRPSYTVANLRAEDHHENLGRTKDGSPVANRQNFPEQDVAVEQAAVIYEIPNAFPFRGTTYIDSSWADAKAKDPRSIALPRPGRTSMVQALEASLGNGLGTSERLDFFSHLPESVLLTLAATSTDPEDLRLIARLCCELLFDDPPVSPVGLRYVQNQPGRLRPVIHSHALFETVVNNPCLPDDYKTAMVLRPGVQGSSEIVGDVRSGTGGRAHVFEYLRRNSYIPWGHYAANMAHDAVRYAIRDLDAEDLFSLRHLYYQRTYVRLADLFGIAAPRRQRLDPDELEKLRVQVLQTVRRAGADTARLPFTATLWGWNFGFDLAPSGYRLHASHQQVHQQYALIPDSVPAAGASKQPDGGELRAFACGDLVADAVERYRTATGHGLFTDYLRAIRANRRTDGSPGQASLVVHEDDQMLLFVPKAQASGFELQLMPLQPVGNVLEADAACRRALDAAMLKAQQVLEGLGARMVTSIEYSRRLNAGDPDQRLLYAFLPKLPYAPGGFSEAQQRAIISHYPEDFALACRMVLAQKLER